MKKALLAVIAMSALLTARPTPAMQCTGYLIPKEAKLWQGGDGDDQYTGERIANIVAVPKGQVRWKQARLMRLYEGMSLTGFAGCRPEDAEQNQETKRVLLFLLDTRRERFEKVWAVLSDLRPFSYDYPADDRYGPGNVAVIRQAADLALDEIRFRDFKPPEIENQRIFNAPFDATWSALIETMSDQRWQVESVDKGSGLITTKPANDRTGSTMACATKYDEGNIVFLNVFVKAIADGVRVKINATFHATREKKVISCYSNGTLEKEFFDGIAKSLAETTPAK